MTTDLLPDCAAWTDAEVRSMPWQPFRGMPHVHVKYLFTRPGTVAGLMRLDPHGHEPRHLHVGSQHHVWIVDGTLHFDGRELAAGSYLHVPAGMTHTLATDADSCTVFFVFTRST